MKLFSLTIVKPGCLLQRKFRKESTYRRWDTWDILWNLVYINHITFYLCSRPSFPHKVYLFKSRLTTPDIPVQTHIRSSVHIWAGIPHKALVRRKSVVCHRITSCQPVLHAKHQKRRNNVDINQETRSHRDRS